MHFSACPRTIDAVSTPKRDDGTGALAVRRSVSALFALGYIAAWVLQLFWECRRRRLRARRRPRRSERSPTCASASPARLCVADRGSASHFDDSWSVSTICNGARPGLSTLLTLSAQRPGAGHHGRACPGWLSLYVPCGVASSDGKANDDRNDITADPRANGPGKALRDCLDLHPSPQLHAEFDRWLRACVVGRCLTMHADALQPGHAPLPAASLAYAV